MDANSITKLYTKEDLTVRWEPAKCIHSKVCWKGLIEVFNPKNKPWVNLDGASKEAIIHQVKQCPSGALSLVEAIEPKPIATENATKIEAKPNGPLLVYGNCVVTTANGEEIRESVTAFCRCGQSTKKPYCDGTHRTVNFVG